MNSFITFVSDNSRSNPPKEERFARNFDRFSTRIGILEIIGNFKWQLLQEKKPSLISDVSSSTSRVKVPLHFTQNMNWEFFLFNNERDYLWNIYFRLNHHTKIE